MSPSDPLPVASCAKQRPLRLCQNTSQRHQGLWGAVWISEGVTPHNLWIWSLSNRPVASHDFFLGGGQGNK